MSSITHATGILFYFIEQHENNRKSVKNQESECSYASNCLVRLVSSITKRPDWAMKCGTALNINEFILFDMFGWNRSTKVLLLKLKTVLKALRTSLVYCHDKVHKMNRCALGPL